MDPSVRHLKGVLALVGEGVDLSKDFKKRQLPGGFPGGDVKASI